MKGVNAVQDSMVAPGDRKTQPPGVWETRRL